MLKKLLALVTAMVLIFAGCGKVDEGGQQAGKEAASSQNGQPTRVVATTTMISDLVKVIGGDHVEVEGLMGPGIDPHGYQATAEDNRKLQEADVAVYNGLHLEGQMGEIFEALEQSDTKTICLEDGLDETKLLASEDASMNHDPHIWFSVARWKEAADHVTKELSAYDPDNAADYQANNEAYQKELDELDTYIKERVAEVPADKRYLVTAHDAFNYFGKDYNFDVVGIQGLNTQTEAGTADFSELAQFIADKGIKSVFVESSVPKRNIEALQEAVKAKGHEVGIGGELYSDSLGDASAGTDTYITMYKANIDTIVDALK
ncbi:manganese transporter [Aerococcus urinaehominis]|uniref:Manganese transporter n=1 Tax=Aerococcus urinaehominis TaxID=128944 RepID=A0A0X8FKA3_9LACT|nr:zinc ABC transporter substrate-binding protein [Aerococcus urinaehominis]AMB98644.1 manganese transporter [Aerococcus urinaehominis]SDL96687.1 manganese/zinc/iron transport system substrate-binding protein [Aerococcus urinaehominis]